MRGKETGGRGCFNGGRIHTPGKKKKETEKENNRTKVSQGNYIKKFTKRK